MSLFLSYGKPGMGSCSMVAQDLRRAVRMWRLLQGRRNPDMSQLSYWRTECLSEAGRLISGQYYPSDLHVPGQAPEGSSGLAVPAQSVGHAP